MIHREEREGVAVLRMERGRANALDLELLRALERVLGELEADEAPAALVLTGTGTVFSAGVDLFRVLDGGRDYLDEFIAVLGGAVRRLFAFPRPVVAAVNGHAIAGGCILACACDRRVMAEGGGRIGVPELRVGVPFPVAPLEVLRFAVPRQHLQEITYTGKTYPPDEALAWGLIDEVAPAEAVLDRALEAARGLAAIPAESFRLTKAHLRAPALERIDRLTPELDPEITALWHTEEIRQHIRDYLERTLGKR